MKIKTLAFGGMVLVILVALIAFISNKTVNKPVCKDCNVILISLDTLSANHLPCYGYNRDTTPNLCKFGKENIMFDNMYANASWTLPSHVSIFTGLLPSQHKVTESYESYLSPQTPFLPDVLQKNGYKTYFYMKLGSNSLPEHFVYNRGIDELHNVTHPNDWNEGLDILLKNNQNKLKTFLFLHTYWVHSPYLLENANRRLFTEEDVSPSNIPLTKKQLYTCTYDFLSFFEKTLTYDLDPKSGKFWNPPQKPFYKELHTKLIDIVRENNPQSTQAFCNDTKYAESLKLYMESSYESRIVTSDKNQVQFVVDTYDSKIKELDEYVQKVIDSVKNSKLKNNTVIIITADHGEEFMEHGSMAHAKNLFDTTLKVPLMMYIPGVQNVTIKSVTQSVDLMPTILDILAIPNTYTFAGIDILDFKNKLLNNRFVQAEQISFGMQTYAIRNNDWKLIYKKKGGKIVPIGLYDTRMDLQEKNNLLFSKNSIVEKMLKNISQ